MPWYGPLPLAGIDDLNYATTSYEHRESIKAETPRKLEKYNLFTNHSKTEEGEAPDKRPPPPPPPPPLTDPGDKLLWSDLDWLMPPVMQPPEPTYKNIKLLGTKIPSKSSESTSFQNASAQNTKFASSEPTSNQYSCTTPKLGPLLQLSKRA